MNTVGRLRNCLCQTRTHVCVHTCQKWTINIQSGIYVEQYRRKGLIEGHEIHAIYVDWGNMCSLEQDDFCRMVVMLVQMNTLECRADVGLRTLSSIYREWSYMKSVEIFCGCPRFCVTLVMWDLRCIEENDTSSVGSYIPWYLRQYRRKELL